MINIQAYTPSRFAMQISFSLGVVELLGNMQHRYGSL